MGQSFRMRTILVCSFAFFLLAIVSEETTWSREIPTRSKVEEIEQELDKVIEKKKLPAAVRLAFHDCVGGCDGCIDPDKPANAGLEPFVKALEPTFKRYEDPHWQWRIPNDNVTFMLNPDVDLFKDIQVDKDGKSSCNFEDCPNSPTANVVQTFAGSNKVWIEAFEKVFAKMLAHGTSSLYDV